VEDAEEQDAMTLVKLLRSGQVTLPADARKALALEEGDYLEAEVIEGALRLKPVSVVDRQALWEKLHEAQRTVRHKGPGPRPDPDVEESAIHEIVREFRERDG
jgi:AbrB family looped-hinge helix DNA binding protein